MEKSYGLLFFLKQSKNSKSKVRFVYARITVDGNSKEYSTKQKWHADRWDQKSGRAVGTKEDARRLNNFLDELAGKVLQAKTELIRESIEISAQGIYNIISGDRKNRKMVLEEFKNHNKMVSELIGNGYAQGTLGKFETTYNHIASFIKLKYNEEDITFSRLDYEFVSELWHWFRSVQNCGNNTTCKHFSTLKKITIHAQKMGWITKDPFATFSTKKNNVNIEVLDESEMQILERRQFTIQRLELVKDLFIFSCYTGLAYVDVKNLKCHQIQKKPDGEFWLQTQRQKTGTSTSLPILPNAMRIIRKYENHPGRKINGSVLPVLSNQKMNAYLKEIADLCEIQKRLTFHIARHTFATTVTLANGVPIETVSSMLGHTSLKHTQHYAKIVDSKKSLEMKALKQKLMERPSQAKKESCSGFKWLVSAD